MREREGGQGGDGAARRGRARMPGRRRRAGEVVRAMADGERGDLAAPALWARCVIVEVAEEERPLSRRRSTSVYKRAQRRWRYIT